MQSQVFSAPLTYSFRAIAPVGRNGVERVLFAALFLAVYFGFDQISSVGPVPPLVLTPWNPALGLCIAAVMHWRKRILPLVFLGPVVSQIVIPDVPQAGVYGAWIGVLTLMQTVSAVALGRWLSRNVGNLLLKNQMAAVLFACLPVTFVIAVLRISFLVLMDIAPAAQFLEGAMRIWVGDVIGIFIIAPLCTLVLSLRRVRWGDIRISVEPIAQAVAVGVAVWVAFGVYPQTASRYFYIAFLPMIWVVLRSGMNGAIVMNAFVLVSMIASLTWAGHAHGDVTLFQALLLVLASSSLTLGIAVDQSRIAMQQLRARESELAASLKVAATGELAGALAHELGHPLGAISNYAAALNYVVAKVAPESGEALSIGNKLSREIMRAMDTLHRLRDFFRTGSLAVERVDIGALAREAVALLKDRLVHNGVSPQLVVHPGVNSVLADRIQIHAVIHNLLVNGIDALKQVPAERRMLAVSVRRTRDAVVLEVDDSGIGVAADVRDHIFEPLTTTKKDGLGLGLSMSRSVITAHGGHIHLEESDLGGAKFVLTLPVEPA